MELAEKLHYSDKAISKWERAESTPDVDALYELSKLFGVTVDYFFHEQKESKAKYIIANAFSWFRRMMWLFIGTFALELVALILFITGQLNGWQNAWMAFVWITPLIAIFTLIFFLRIRNWLGSVISGSIISWVIIAAIYLQLLVINPASNIWYLFLLGIPITGAVILFAFIVLDSKKKKMKSL